MHFAERGFGLSSANSGVSVASSLHGQPQHQGTVLEFLQKFVYKILTLMARLAKKLKHLARNCISPLVSTTTKQFNKNANGSVPFKIIVDSII